MGLRRKNGPNPTRTSSKLFELHTAPACAADEDVLGDQRVCMSCTHHNSHSLTSLSNHLSTNPQR